MKSIKNHPQKIAVLFFSAMLLAGSGLRAVGDGAAVLAKLALDEAAARESILDSLASGSVYNYAAIEAFKAIPAASRAEIVRSGLGWIKAYVESAGFKTAYGEYRNGKKPKAPATRPSGDEQMKQQRADFEKQVADMRKNMAGVDPATREALEKNIKEMRAQMEAMEKDPEQKELMRQMAEMARSEDIKNYDERLKAWNESFPADPRALIKKRIADFLSASAGVDYAAKLEPRGDKMAFVRDDYEQKSPEWKICFRAGREATEAARAFAKAWLTGLEGK